MNKDIENYVCSLEQAKKLKELGVEQDSLYFWTKELGAILDKEGLHINYIILSNEHVQSLCFKYGYDGDPYTLAYSAFTSQELGEMLIENTGISWLSNIYLSNIYDEREAQARAKILIYLLEKKHEIR